MESASDINARLSQARRHQWKRVSGERETRLQRLRTAQQLRLAAEKRVAPARQTMIYIRLVFTIGKCHSVRTVFVRHYSRNSEVARYSGVEDALRLRE